MADLSLPAAERAVIGTLLAYPERVGEVAAELRPEQFDGAPERMVYERILQAFWGGTPIEVVAIAGPIAHNLGEVMGIPGHAAVEKMKEYAKEIGLTQTPLAEHATLLRRYADRRQLLELAAQITTEVERDEMAPAAIAGIISQRSLHIATTTQIASEIVDFGDAGRRFINTTRYEMDAVTQGIELGVKTGIRGIDEFSRGRRPGRLYITAGEPGVGKSAVEWIGGLNYAKAQAKKSKDKQLATLFLSMEMGEHDSSGRFAQAIGHIQGETIQDATLSAVELTHLTEEWGKLKDIPLYLNYAPNLRCSEMLAIVSEAVRRFNVGYVIVDHFRTFDLDKPLDDKNAEDEEKARFLREQIARSLNVAVVCIAHTRKPDAQRQHGRPHMADLRGSGQIAAHADMISFVYRPIRYASPTEIDLGEVKETDAEMIHRKNRQGVEATGDMYFDPSTMTIY